MSDSGYLIEDTVLETGTRAVWPDNNELGTCNTTVGVASLDEQFAGLSIPDEYGNTCVYNILQSSALFLFLSCVLTQHTIFSILYLP